MNNQALKSLSDCYSPEIIAAAKKIRWLVLDVDGVLTDGRLYYGNNGEELKAFNIQDGLGIKLLQKAGIGVAVITGRSSALVDRRARELGINPVVQGREDKLTALQELQALHPMALEEIAYIGDDLPDLAVIRRVGLGITPANGRPHIAAHAVIQTNAAGGHGAVREIADLLISAQGQNALFDTYL